MKSKFTVILRKSFGTLKVKNVIFLTLAGIINAIGVTMFLAPVNLYDSGLSGTSLLMWQALPGGLPLSFFLIVLNIPFYLIGAKKLGFAFTVYSIYAIAIYSLFSYLIQNVLPIDVATSSPVAGTDKMLCALFGGLVSGVGSGLTIRYGGAIDGVEVLAVISAKYIGLTVGTFVMAYNTIVYVAAALVFQSWEIPLYSVIAYAIGLKTVDFVVDGFDKAKGAFVITTKENGKSDEIAALISQSMGIGITLLDAKGYYTQEEKVMLYCAVNRFQIGKLKKLISSVDPQAFVTITEISETIGNSIKLSKTRRKK